MQRFDRQILTQAILSAPGWARIGLTMRDAHMRERAADALAASIVERLEEGRGTPDRDQLALPI